MVAYQISSSLWAQKKIKIYFAYIIFYQTVVHILFGYYI